MTQTQSEHNPADYINSVSVDPLEMESFARMAADWWDPSGPFKPLHIMNRARLSFIKATLCAHFGRDPEQERPLLGLRLLDIGCGGGLLCEPMARLGASVTGIDALERNLKTAQTHAQDNGIEIDYRHTTIEQLGQSHIAPFDAILNMEVIEHVINPSQFMKDCAKMLRGSKTPKDAGGIMICSTINRTFKAFSLAILGAEYVLRWLPKGTHQYDKFIKPIELARFIEDAGLELSEQTGMVLNPLTDHWRLSGDKSVNYVSVAVKSTIRH